MRISRQQQQSLQSSTGPFWVPNPVWMFIHEANLSKQMINGLKNQAKKSEFSPSPILGEGASTEEFYSQESAKLRRAGQELMKKWLIYFWRWFVMFQIQISSRQLDRWFEGQGGRRNSKRTLDDSRPWITFFSGMCVYGVTYNLLLWLR